MSLRALSLSRRAQFAFLVVAGTLTLPLYLTGHLPSRRMRALSIFPTPVVFTTESYRLKRELRFFYSDMTAGTLSQSDLLKRNYGPLERWRGVMLWHFLKYSPDWPVDAQRAALRVLFCRGQSNPELVEYTVEQRAWVRESCP